MKEVRSLQNSGSLESSKTELRLALNSFEKPDELSDVSAWSQLLLNLIFLKPGTYPSIPGMGVGIENYQYDFLDDAIDQLTAAIVTQQQTYLPDIPLASVQISKVLHSGSQILVIHMMFNAPSITKDTAIAINTSKRNFLDFDVSW